MALCHGMLTVAKYPLAEAVIHSKHAFKNSATSSSTPTGTAVYT